MLSLWLPLDASQVAKQAVASKLGTDVRELLTRLQNERVNLQNECLCCDCVPRARHQESGDAFGCTRQPVECLVHERIPLRVETSKHSSSPVSLCTVHAFSQYLKDTGS